MIGERHTAVRALADVAASLTDHGSRKAAAVQEENSLLTMGKALLDGLQEGWGTDGFGTARTRRPAHIEHPNDGHPVIINTLREPQESILPRGAIVPTFHRRSCAAENHRAALQLRPQDGNITSVIPRRLFLFVCTLMFFVDDDDSKIFQGRKDGTSRTDDNSRTARMNLPPFIEAFAS